MLEGGNNMVTIAPESAVIAIVQDDDVASGLALTGDARESLDQSLGGLRFPVPANF